MIFTCSKPPKDAHAALDTAVLADHGFNAKKDLPAQLFAFNQEAATQIARGNAVTAPGIPKNYPNPKTSLLRTAYNHQIRD